MNNMLNEIYKILKIRDRSGQLSEFLGVKDPDQSGRNVNLNTKAILTILYTSEYITKHLHYLTIFL